MGWFGEMVATCRRITQEYPPGDGNRAPNCRFELIGQVDTHAGGVYGPVGWTMAGTLTYTARQPYEVPIGPPLPDGQRPSVTRYTPEVFSGPCSAWSSNGVWDLLSAEADPSPAFSTGWSPLEGEDVEYPLQLR